MNATERTGRRGRTPGATLVHLRAWREWRMLSTSALARLAGMSPSGITTLESRKWGASLQTQVRLARALQITIEQLLDEDPSGPRQPLELLQSAAS